MKSCFISLAAPVENMNRILSANQLPGGGVTKIGKGTDQTKKKNTTLVGLLCYKHDKITMSTAEFPDSVSFILEFSRLLQAYIRFVKNLPISFFYCGPCGTCNVFRCQVIWTPRNLYRSTLSILRGCKKR